MWAVLKLDPHRDAGGDELQRSVSEVYGLGNKCSFAEESSPKAREQVRP